MNNLVVIDSQIFIWGIKGYAQPTQQGNIQKAKAFIKWLGDQKSKILMPVPQMIEIMSYAPPQEQEAIRSLIDSRFMVVPVDELAAIKCAEILYTMLNDEEIRKFRDGQLVTKNRIKFDCMIIATAIVRNASKIYSEDPDFKRFAKGHIDVFPLPNLGIAQDLFKDLSA